MELPSVRRARTTVYNTKLKVHKQFFLLFYCHELTHNGRIITSSSGYEPPDLSLALCNHLGCSPRNPSLPPSATPLSAPPTLLLLQAASATIPAARVITLPAGGYFRYLGDGTQVHAAGNVGARGYTKCFVSKKRVRNRSTLCSVPQGARAGPRGCVCLTSNT